MIFLFHNGKNSVMRQHWFCPYKTYSAWVHFLIWGMLSREKTAIPDRWGMSSHNCGCDHKMLCQLYTSAKVFVSSLFLRPLQMCRRSHTKSSKSNRVHDGQQKWAMAVSVYPQLQDTAPRICIVHSLLSSQFQSLLCRNGTFHSLWNTCILKFKTTKLNERFRTCKEKRFNKLFFYLQTKTLPYFLLERRT